MLKPLTKRQFDVYTFIVKYQRKQGIMPTLREIAAASGTKSQSAIHAHIGQLVSRGYLQRHANLSRALEITEEAQELAAKR